jgi:hypothetical protein
MNAPQHNGGPELASRQDFLLASMRVATLNLKSWTSEVEMIGIALRNNMIDVEEAVAQLDDLGVLHWRPTPTMRWRHD